MARSRSIAASLVARARIVLACATGEPNSSAAKRMELSNATVGTTTLFAALNVLYGAVLAECKARHRHQEFLSFRREIDKSVPADLDIHCIADNYDAHKHAKVRVWLAQRPRWNMHFIPTYSPWLNQVERFFALITDKAIRRGSLRSVPGLIRKIDHFVSKHNQSCRPFV